MVFSVISRSMPFVRTTTGSESPEGVRWDLGGIGRRREWNRWVGLHVIWTDG